MEGVFSENATEAPAARVKHWEGVVFLNRPPKHLYGLRFSAKKKKKKVWGFVWELLTLQSEPQEILNNGIMNSTDNEIYRKIHFAVMAIESGARKLGITGKEMHDRLKKQGLIHNRLIKRYDNLHTQSLDWVADDISETLLNWESER